MREKQALQELQARRQQVVAEEARLVTMQQHEISLRRQQQEPLRRGDDLYEFQMRRHFLEQAIETSVKEQVDQQGRIRDAIDAVAQQESVLTQCGIDVKALEKLKEKQQDEHREQQLREEGLFMDDLAGQGFLRRRKHAQRIAAEEQVAKQRALDAPPPPPQSAPPPPSSPNAEVIL